MFSKPTLAPGNPDLNPSSGGTWLLSTGGGGAREIDPRPLHLAWAPDSQQFAYILPQDPQAIVVYDITTRASSVVARVLSPIRGLAWSPDSSQLAVTYPIPGDLTDRKDIWGIEMAAVSSTTGQEAFHVDFPGVDPGSPANPDLELEWTASGSELWYLPAMAAFDIDRKAVEPLVAPSEETYRAFQPPTLDPAGVTLTQIAPNGSRMASAINVEYNGNDNWITVRSLLPNPPGAAGQPLLRPVGAVAALAWTANSEGLIIAGGTDTPQPIWRMDPVTGDTRTLTRNAYFIGLRSTLQSQSQHLAPEAQITDLPDASRKGGQVETDFPAFHLRLSVPAGWHVSQPVEPRGWAQIASVDLTGTTGLASIEPNQMVIQISQETPIWVAGLTTDYQQLGNVPPGPLWEPIKVAGHIAYRLTHPLIPGGPQVIQIPNPGKAFPFFGDGITITKYPFTGSDDPIFDQILQSFEYH
jgi:hypothetical protein